ncbi:MAG: endolytic transglycosylase MltG, partial [Alphaproteobacteria bacterium]
MTRRSAVVLASGLLLLIVVAVAGWAWRGWVAPGPLDRHVQVVVPAGAGLGEIARHLADAGVIRSPLTFTLGVRSSGLARVLQAGEYAFGPDISARQAARLIASGRIVVR